MILAGASVDDIYVIVLFTAFMGMANGGKFDLVGLIKIPIAIINGLLLGVVVALGLIKLFKQIHMRDTVKILILMSTSFLFIALEAAIKTYFPLSGYLAVMALGGTILKQYDILAERLASKFSKIWVAAELTLFVLVGATMDIGYASKASLAALTLIILALSFRMLGVLICLIKTPLNSKEKVFTAIAYLPKATVQAAIGSIPLAAGLNAGSTILTVAVLAILLTAPLGATGVDLMYRKLLTKEE